MPTTTRTKLAGILLAVSGLTLAGCGEPVVGTVIDKEYDDADTVRGTRQECTTTTTGTGAAKKTSTKCKQVPTTHHEGEEWELTVEQDEDGDIVETDVPEKVWKRLEVGDHYDSEAGKR